MKDRFQELSPVDIKIFHDFVTELRDSVQHGSLDVSHVTLPILSENVLDSIRRATYKYLPLPEPAHDGQVYTSDFVEYGYLRTIDHPPNGNGDSCEHPHHSNRFFYNGGDMPELRLAVPQLDAAFHVIEILFHFRHKMERVGPLLNISNVIYGERPKESKRAKPKDLLKCLPMKQHGHIDYDNLIEELLCHEAPRPGIFGNLPLNFVLAIDSNVSINIFTTVNEWIRGKDSTSTPPNRSSFEKHTEYSIPPGQIALFTGDCFHGGVRTRDAGNKYLRFHGYLTTEPYRIGRSVLSQGWLCNYLNFIFPTLSNKKKRKLGF